MPGLSGTIGEYKGDFLFLNRVHHCGRGLAGKKGRSGAGIFLTVALAESASRIHSRRLWSHFSEVRALRLKCSARFYLEQRRRSIAEALGHNRCSHEFRIRAERRATGAFLDSAARRGTACKLYVVPAAAAAAAWSRSFAALPTSSTPRINNGAFFEASSPQ
jgi:hypothetical protein